MVEKNNKKEIADIQQQILDKESHITKLQIERQNLQEQLITLAPFQPGDRVRVIDTEWRRNESVEPIDERVLGEFYVKEVSLHYQKEFPFTYTFTRSKKDGTRGGQSSRIYWNGYRMRLEKVS